VHTLEEIALLQSRFPDEIRLLVAKHAGIAVAGALLFETDRVSHAQYIAATPKGRELAALDAVFDVAIQRASAGGRRYFDFGISTEQGGKLLNDGLYEFKAGFGGSGVVHDFYEIALT
jgi:lipid II:glycine glycyltransferase (peptidoglycan interpeptide bridge formation enzyme)